MGIKIVDESKPNQLLGVIKREYSRINILLIFSSILSLGLCGELWKNRENINLIPEFTFCLVILIFFIIIILIVGSFSFFKGFILQSKQISWPSVKEIFFNVMQVIVFTSLLAYFINYCDDFIKFIQQFGKN